MLWSEAVGDFIATLVGPLRVVRIAFDESNREAHVTVRKAEMTINVSESRIPDFALRGELLMDLTGWKLNVVYAAER